MVAPSPGAYGGNGVVLMGVTWTLATLAIVLVALRLFVAARMVHRVTWDSFWIVVALLFGITAQILVTLSAAYGLGQGNMMLLTDIDLLNCFHYLAIATAVGLLTPGLGKIAVVAVLLQIQGTHTHKKGRIFLHFVWISAMATSILQMALEINSCSPVRKLWMPTIPGNCNLKANVVPNVGDFTGAWSATCDIALAVYPIVIFWSLSMSWKKKFGLCLLLGGGILAGIAAAIRTSFVQFTRSSDPYTISRLMIWVFVEIWLIIILGTIPTLRPLFVKVFYKASSVIHRSTHHSSHEESGYGTERKASIRMPGYSTHRGTVESRNESYRGAAKGSDTESIEAILPIQGHILVNKDVDVDSTRDHGFDAKELPAAPYEQPVYFSKPF